MSFHRCLFLLHIIKFFILWPKYFTNFLLHQNLHKFLILLKLSVKDKQTELTRFLLKILSHTCIYRLCNGRWKMESLLQYVFIKAVVSVHLLRLFSDNQHYISESKYLGNVIKLLLAFSRGNVVRYCERNYTLYSLDGKQFKQWRYQVLALSLSVSQKYHKLKKQLNLTASSIWRFLMCSKN